MTAQQQEALGSTLESLLSWHSCVSAVELRHWNVLCLIQEKLFKALKNARGLKEISINDFQLASPQFARRLLRELAEVTYIEKLYINILPRSYDPFRALNALIENSESLTSLSLPIGHPDTTEAYTFWTNLEENDQIQELCLDAGIVLPSSSNNMLYLTDYMKFDRSIRHICIKTTQSLPIEYLCSNMRNLKHLRSITFIGFVINNRGAQALKSFTRNCPQLEEVLLKNCLWDNTETIVSTTGIVPVRPVEAFIGIIEGSVCLRTLSISFTGLPKPECVAILKAALKNRSLTEVFVEDLGRFLAVEGRNDPSTPRELLRDFIPPLQHITVLIEAEADCEWAIEVLKVSGPAESILFDISATTTEEFQAVTKSFLSSTKTVKVLSVKISENDENMGQCILQGLYKNCSVREFSLNFWEASSNFCERLALYLSETRQVHTVRFCSSKANLEAFLQLLAPIISSNKTICELDFPTQKLHVSQALFDVISVIHRNRSCASRILQFIKERSGKEGAQLFETEGSNSYVEDQLCKCYRITTEQAKKKVEDTRTFLKSITGFLRATGVVRRALDCIPNGRRFQITDLDEYSWGIVRRYLKIEDVSQ
ncbi:hypothetical protein HPB48_001709 [Haemaphysalis longicornis]|uniref:Uncharacterized protein n=1 Tax=Haemaphysalis longicornis TaxID=44386 RepID=A0A9J6GZ13_HAELO|nr:hypothetical protein HPB48_001709 [Haemaphysalis longicornis]